MTHNFGQPSNQEVCSCGRHHGTGQWSPEKRRETYEFQRDRIPNHYSAGQRAYLEDWEKHHAYNTPAKPHWQDGNT